MPQTDADNARVAGIILAAGASTRFGSPKQLARIGKRTILETVVDVALAAGLDPVLVVVPPGMAVPPEVVPVVNDDPAAGLSRSLRLGVHAAPGDVAAVVILLGDQPTLEADDVRRLVAARGAAPVVASESNGLRMPPVVLERTAFALVDTLEGDEGLRSLLRSGSSDIAAVPVSSLAADVDTPEDLARLSLS
ncbi:MAG: nucleotidyltransferase family protein [Candidatus Limnocylindria bacterium]